MSLLTRKKFLLHSVMGTAGILLLPGTLRPQQAPGKTQEKGPPLEAALVKEFVQVAHRDINTVKTMYEATPALLNAVWNLGEWDWEDAIGAAGHTGNREMALYLLEKGARPTICVAAMLGQLEVVKSFITAFPAMKDAVGPHKISLVRHAKAGGEQAAMVLEYLQSIGAKA